MEEAISKEKILKKIRNALISKADLPFADVDFETSVYKKSGESLAVSFAEEFIESAGKFVYCTNPEQAIENLKLLITEKQWKHIFALDPVVTNILEKGQIQFSSKPDAFELTEVGITACEFLLARLGSIMVSSSQMSGRRLNAYPEFHIVFAFTSQLVPDLKEAFLNLQKKYENNLPSMISVITGPSRTGDIEKTLVMGAHGPKELYLFLIEDAI